MSLACEGAPRDLGLDQGRAMGEGVDAELGRILRARGAGGSRALGRDVRRHFPHLAERMAGLARGANVARAALMAALARASAEPDFLFRPARAAGLAAPAAPRALLGGRFDLSADRSSVPIVRRSRPQGGHPSVELTLPWLASSLAGVNAEGLAVLLAPPGPAALDGPVRRAEAPCRAPALLFVQQCLERFDRVESALDWCLSRPSGACAALFLADAAGGLAGLALDGEERQLVAATSPGFLWSAAGAAPPPDPDTARDALSGEGTDLPALLAGGIGPAADPLAHRAYVWLDPLARTLSVVLDPEGLAPARVERFGVRPEDGAPGAA